MTELLERHRPLTFREFVPLAWKWVDPAPFVPGWHVDAISNHLEAAFHRQIRNLVINIPPRHMKSITCSVMFPAWVWTRRPSEKFLYTSYAESLAVRDAVKTRRLLQSYWYQKRWGHLFRLTGDANTKTYYENDKMGYRFSVGVAGGSTGHGGDFIMADDPHKVNEAESDVVRQGVIDWWRETMSTRGNDPKTVVRVIVMQRVHQGDLAGEMLAEELGYEHLCLPARYEAGESRRKTSIGFTDPRVEDGELLWPERIDDEALTELETQLGPYGTAGQLQQRPAPRQGGFFEADKILIVPERPAAADVIARYRFWDKASTTTGDWSVGVLMSRLKNGLFVVEDVQRERVITDRRDALMLQTAQVDGKDVKVFEEEEGGSSGKDVTSHHAKMFVGFTFAAKRSTGSKEVRASPFASQVNAGNVRMVAAPWNRAYLDELRMFPSGKYDDQVDGSSGVFNELASLVQQPVTSRPLLR